MKQPVKHSLSILLPVYNNVCTALVERLKKQADLLNAQPNYALDYEIIVGDDGSTDIETVDSNSYINGLDNCRYIRRPENKGRAAIRNYLANEAKYEILLFLDSDLFLERDNFIHQYLEHSDCDVVYGGIDLVKCNDKGRLRYKYENVCLASHAALRRSRYPYRDFHTANFMIRRNIMLKHPFDERIKKYGYEDVIFGKELDKFHIPILHIDNPMHIFDFESNEEFLKKTEEGLHTLYDFRDDLKGFSRILRIVGILRMSGTIPVLRLWHKCMRKRERNNLLSKKPSLIYFKLYKLGYFISIKTSNNKKL
jgi:glycosyltransferase involved in cell wall biosynthesis